MLLNGLGFVSAPLYWFEPFFVGKATEPLLGAGLTAECVLGGGFEWSVDDDCDAS